MPELIEPTEVVSIDTGHEAPILGVGEFDDHPGQICFVGQDGAGKRLAIFFSCDRERAAAMCAAIMEHANIRQVSIGPKGLSYQCGAL